MMAQKIIENTNQRIPPQCKNVSGEHTDPEDVNFQCEIVDKSSVEEYMIMSNCCYVGTLSLPRSLETRSELELKLISTECSTPSEITLRPKSWLNNGTQSQNDNLRKELEEKVKLLQKELEKKSSTIRKMRKQIDKFHTADVDVITSLKYSANNFQARLSTLIADGKEEPYRMGETLESLSELIDERNQSTTLKRKMPGDVKCEEECFQFPRIKRKDNNGNIYGNVEFDSENEENDEVPLKKIKPVKLWKKRGPGYVMCDSFDGELHVLEVVSVSEQSKNK